MPSYGCLPVGTLEQKHIVQSLILYFQCFKLDGPNFISQFFTPSVSRSSNAPTKITRDGSFLDDLQTINHMLEKCELINIIAKTPVLYSYIKCFIRTGESGEINSQHPRRRPYSTASVHSHGRIGRNYFTTPSMCNYNLRGSGLNVVRPPYNSPCYVELLSV